MATFNLNIFIPVKPKSLENLERNELTGGRFPVELVLHICKLKTS